MKDNIRRASQSTRHLLSTSESVLTGDVNHFVGRESLLRTKSPSVGDGYSDEEEETLHPDEYSVQQLQEFDTTLLEDLPSLDVSIYNRLVYLQEKVIEVAKEAMEQSNNGSELQVVTAPTLAPPIMLDNPSAEYLAFRTQWGNNFLLPFEPCETWEVC
jgi:hypothetical protein